MRETQSSLKQSFILFQRYGAVVRSTGAYVPPGARGGGKASTPPAQASSPSVAVTSPTTTPGDAAKKSTNGSAAPAVPASAVPKVSFCHDLSRISFCDIYLIFSTGK